MSKVVGFVLRDPLGRQPEQPVPESLSLRARLADGTIIDMGMVRDGTAIEVRLLPGSGQYIGFVDLAIFPQVSNVVLIKAVPTELEKGAKVRQ